MSQFPDARILYVDLSSGKVSARTIPGATYRLYPGGCALAAYLIMSERMDPAIDPLSEEALLVFAVSPTVGLPFSGNSRMTIAAKSPLTGTFGTSESGGYFPAHLAANAWDAILFGGRAPAPVYLYIDGENVSLRDASAIWGRTTLETETMLKAELGDSQVEIAEIGPAGENLVRFASIMTLATRANARNGIGAVMGSKRLKAVVCKRQKPRQALDREGFRKAFAEQVVAKIEANAATRNLGINGTNSGLKATSDGGFLMTRNGNLATFGEDADKITGNLMTQTILKKRESCYACSVRCKRAVSIPERDVIPEYGGPEYESVATLGALCGVADMGDICVANQLCNMYGIDTISAGATIAFAMECYENGLIDKATTGGIELSWGKGSVFEPLLEQMARRSTPFGDSLAEGSARMAERIGGGSEKFFMGVKRQEFPAHMPMYKHGIALHYSVNPHGADHASCTHDQLLMGPDESEGRMRMASLGLWKGYENCYTLDDEKVRMVVLGERFYTIMNIFGLCVLAWGPGWQLYGPADLLSVLKYGLGFETSIEDLMLCAERQIAMMRFFNFLAGVRPAADDTLPERVFSPLRGGKLEGLRLDRENFEKEKAFYYEMTGTDPTTGCPRESKLRSLSLQWLLDGYRGSAGAGTGRHDNGKGEGRC
jgi:aldehyde:ferredoxin oxidoreductase